MNHTELFEYIYLSVYFAILFVLSIYGVHRYYLTYLYFKYSKQKPIMKELDLNAPLDVANLPKVTVQLPIFNEQYVAERLIDAVCVFDYPQTHLEIQVLDDSTDETVTIVGERVKMWQAKGVDITHVHRLDRKGYKAGALANGLKLAKGELIAVFDADFVPHAAFLRSTVGHFTDANVGMVQVRWEHLNREFSPLTQAQSILLDGHFVIEHSARNRSGCFFNFNGTAGIWRKSAIESAGGWEHDTLTEDLDLSYRAQLKGWKFVFLQDVVSPGEIPVDINAFKSQQNRWAKGSVQTAIKLLPRILKSDQSLKVKTEAFFHLTANFAYPLLVLLSLLMPIAIFIRYRHGLYQLLLLDLPCFIAATISVCAFYWVSQREMGELSWQRIKYIPFVMSLGIGLALSNSRAVLEAIWGYETPFTRTPKHGVMKKGERWKNKAYRGGRSLLPWFEIAMGIYYSFTLYMAVETKHWLSIPFLFIFQLGYIYVGLLSLFQSFSVGRLWPLSKAS